MGKGQVGMPGEERAFRRIEKAMKDNTNIKEEIHKMSLKYQLEHEGDLEKFTKRFPSELSYNYAVQDYLQEKHRVPDIRGALMDAFGEKYLQEVKKGYKLERNVRETVKILLDNSYTF